EPAGLRCERKPLLCHRGTNTPTQGDHIYPWSKGGRTVMSNQQALCPFHNARKSGSVPSRMYILRLQWRRRRYFPGDVPTRVEWQAGAATCPDDGALDPEPDEFSSFWGDSAPLASSLRRVASQR